MGGHLPRVRGMVVKHVIWSCVRWAIVGVGSEGGWEKGPPLEVGQQLEVRGSLQT